MFVAPGAPAHPQAGRHVLRAAVEVPQATRPWQTLKEVTSTKAKAAGGWALELPGAAAGGYDRYL